MSAGARIAVAALAIVAGGLVDAAASASDVTYVIAYYVPAVLAVTILAGAELGLAFALLGFAGAWILATDASFALLAMAGAGAIVYAIAAMLRLVLDEVIRRRTLLDALGDAATAVIVSVDRDGHIRDHHPRLDAMVGAQWSAYADEPWAGAIHADDHDKLPRLPPEDDAHIVELRLCNRQDGHARWHELRAVPLYDAGGDHDGWACLLRDIHDTKLARERDDILVGEARHRLRNLVTVIEALAKSSRRQTDNDIDAFLDRFLGRLRALGAAGDLVLAGNRAAVEAGALMRATLRPFMDMATIEPADKRIEIAGPELALSEQTGGSLALAVHELATNALKYGALSRQDGTVALTWSRTPAEDGEAVEFAWRECGGPTPVPPEREGFGTRVIKFAPAHEKNGRVAFDYTPDGLVCTIAFMHEAPENLAE